MRTAKCIAILLIVALIGMLTAAQEVGASALPQRPSGARTAECLLRITVDPGIIPLNQETVANLLNSAAVLGRAAKEVLGIDAPQDLPPLFSIQWLPETVQSAGTQVPRSRAEAPEHDDEMMRQLEQIYGRDYMKQMSVAPRSGRRSSSPADPPAAIQSAPREQSPQGSPRRDTESPYGGMGGGYGGFGGSAGVGGGATMRGGMMGGGMGGMGMPGGMGGFYGAPAGSDTERPAEQRATIKLIVEVPDSAKPVADQFIKALAENLRTSLTDAYEKRKHEFANRLTFAESRLTDAEVRLERAMGGDSPGQMRVNDQLDMIVDLSGLTPEMPVREGVELLRNSVDPPLQIVVLWRDLEENAQITPDSPIQMDGLTDVKVRTALEALLEALGAGSIGLSYRIGDNVVTVGTAETLGASARLWGRVGGGVGVGTTETLGMSARLVSVPRVESDLQALAARRTELARTVQNLELELAGREARRKAIAEEIVQTERQTQERLARDQVTKELESIIQLNEENLSNLRKQADAGSVSRMDLAQATENLTRARIELAKRREELSKQVGGGQLEQLTSEMGRIAIDRAEKQAQLNTVHQQLEEVQQQLAEASTFDPEAARIRMAREAFDVAARQVAEWQMRLASLQPPMVTLIGAN